MWDYESFSLPMRGKVVAQVGEHTHIYTFAPANTDFAVQTVKRHVCEGRLHPYAGLIICNMMRELESDEP